MTPSIVEQFDYLSARFVISFFGSWGKEHSQTSFELPQIPLILLHPSGCLIDFVDKLSI